MDNYWIKLNSFEVEKENNDDIFYKFVPIFNW